MSAPALVEQAPAFLVGGIPVHGDAVLSPMDGYSDLPFRRICRELGSAMSYTEFVSVDELLNKTPIRRAWRKLRFDAAERPVTFQVYGHDEGKIVAAALRIQELEPDILDINMGCYVKSVSERGAGSGMLCRPDLIERVFRRLTSSLKIPVTAKIRLGWDEQARNYRQVARILEDSGAALIAVHGRTRSQAYKGQADWDAIAEVKQCVRIPVLGNGDVRTVGDISRMKAHTGCDGVLIGRAAIGNPWIFSRKDPEQVTPADRLRLLRRHLALNMEFYGEQAGLLFFRKHSKHYVAGAPELSELKLPLLTSSSVEEFDRILDAAAASL